MENASKALLIAGGILVSVLIISVCVMVYNNMTSLSNSNQQILEAEQLAKYNMQWESYNRDNLRGADVISIINKAIDINEKYQIELDDNDFTMINVYVDIKENLGAIEETWVYNEDIKKYVKDDTTSSEILSEGIYNIEKLKEFVTNANSLTKEYEIEITIPNEEYIKSYNEFSTFKLLTTFKCADTEDNTKSGIVYDEFGRITEIHFVQTKLSYE